MYICLNQKYLFCCKIFLHLRGLAVLRSLTLLMRIVLNVLNAVASIGILRSALFISNSASFLSKKCQLTLSVSEDIVVDISMPELV